MYQMKFTLNTFGKVVIKICSFVVLFRMSVMKSLKNAYSKSDKMHRRSRTLEKDNHAGNRKRRQEPEDKKPELDQKYT